MSARTPGRPRGWATRPRACWGASAQPHGPRRPIGTLLFPALMIFGPFIGFSMFGGMLVGWAQTHTDQYPQLPQDRPRRQPDHHGRPASNLLIVLVAVAVMVVMAIALPTDARLFSTLHRNPQPGCGLHSAAAGTAVHAGDFDQPVALHLQPASHTTARWQSADAQYAALQRCAGLRPDSYLGQLSADDFCGRNDYQGFRSSRIGMVVWD